MRPNKLEELRRNIEELKVTRKTMIDRKNQFIKVIPYEIELNNGQTFVRERQVKGNSDGSSVIIIPELTNGELLVAIEPRVFTDKTVSVGFPAGYIEPDESVIDAAKRELLEETGFIANSYQYLDSSYQDEGISSSKVNFVYAQNVRQVASQQLDESENIRYMVVTLDELKEIEGMGYFNSSNQKLALYKMKERKLL